MMWLFTDSAGYIKRKKEEHSKLENIVLHFIGPNKQLSQEATQQNEDMIMASYILDNEYHLLTQQQTILKITGGLAKSESVQMLPRPNGDVTSRLLTEVKKTDGRFVYKF